MLYITIMEFKYNIAIVGSGLTGSIASLALAKAGYNIALIDPKSLFFSSITNINPFKFLSIFFNMLFRF